MKTNLTKSTVMKLRKISASKTVVPLVETEFLRDLKPGRLTDDKFFSLNQVLNDICNAEGNSTAKKMALDILFDFTQGCAAETV